MTKAHVGQLGRLGTGALVLLVVHGYGAPCSAWARCGHPVGSQPGSFGELYRLDLIFMAGLSSTSHDGLSRSPLELPARHSPCSGLSCSSRDPLPISTASPGPLSSQQWGAAFVVLVDLDTTSPSGRTFDEPAPSAIGEKRFHLDPPRA